MTWQDDRTLKGDFDEEIREHFELLCRTVLDGAEQLQNVLKLLIDAYLTGHNGELTQKEIGHILYPSLEIEKASANARRAISTLGSRLRERSNSSDVISFQLPKRDGYWLIVERPNEKQERAPSALNDRRILDKLEGRRDDGRQKTFYAYHLTLGDDRKLRWYCKEAQFRATAEGGPLVANVLILPRAGMTDQEERKRYQYVYKAAAPVNTAQLILAVRHVKSPAGSVIATEVFPKVHEFIKFPWCGLVIANQTFVNNPASSISILHDEPLNLTTADKSRIGDGEPITAPETIDELNHIWHSRAAESDLGIDRLPYGTWPRNL